MSKKFKLRRAFARVLSYIIDILVDISSIFSSKSCNVCDKDFKTRLICVLLRILIRILLELSEEDARKIVFRLVFRLISEVC